MTCSHLIVHTWSSLWGSRSMGYQACVRIRVSLPSLRAEVTSNLLQTIVMVSIGGSWVHHVAKKFGDLVSNQPMRWND